MATENGTAVVTLEKTPQRGALQVLVMPNTAIISAGNSFSVAVSIINPFDIPITVRSVSTLLPVDLYDIALASRLREKMQAEQKLNSIREDFLRQIGKQSTSPTYTKEGMLRPVLKSLFSLMPTLPVAILTNVASTAVARVSEAELRQGALKQYADAAFKLFAESKPIEDLSDEEDEEIDKRVTSLLKPLQKQFAEQYEKEIEQPITLQPGDSVTKVFTLRTRHGITFRPTSYQLNIQISYDVDKVKHSQTIPYSLNIQSSITAVIIGAAIGSLFGVLANNTSILSWSLETTLPKFLLALILSAFTVIAFVRKEGVQPVIAIQDIWGGLLIGFLIGYTGPQVFGSIFGNPNTPISTPTPTLTPTITS